MSIEFRRSLRLLNRVLGFRHVKSIAKFAADFQIFATAAMECKRYCLLRSCFLLLHLLWESRAW